MQWIEVPTPIGRFGLAAADGEITALHFGGVGRQTVTEDPPPVLRRGAEQVAAYFAGELTEFDLPLAAPAGSEFEKAVWKQISAVPYGEMITYGEIASLIADVSASRAVGTACNHNPVPIIVACHRVVGAGGKLVGFGGGIDRKKFLLQLEARVRIEREFMLT